MVQRHNKPYLSFVQQQQTLTDFVNINIDDELTANWVLSEG
jgi:hypothetical protein